MLATMFLRPVEIFGATKIIDLFEARPTTRFSDQVQTLDSLGLSMTNTEHAFFIPCYLRYNTDPFFCSNGIFNNTSLVVTIPPGEAVPPRASILKCTPKRFRKMFLAQQASQKVSQVGNASLNLMNGGGLKDCEQLPKEIHTLFARFCYGKLYKKIQTYLWQLKLSVTSRTV
jgi:hypothetical protein